jgi:hypothetical protein
MQRPCGTKFRGPNRYTRGELVAIAKTLGIQNISKKNMDVLCKEIADRAKQQQQQKPKQQAPKQQGQLIRRFQDLAKLVAEHLQSSKARQQEWEIYNKLEPLTMKHLKDLQAGVFPQLYVIGPQSYKTVEVIDRTSPLQQIRQDGKTRIGDYYGKNLQDEAHVGDWENSYLVNQHNFDVLEDFYNSV